MLAAKSSNWRGPPSPRPRCNRFHCIAQCNENQWIPSTYGFQHIYGIRSDPPPLLLMSRPGIVSKLDNEGLWMTTADRRARPATTDHLPESPLELPNGSHPDVVPVQTKTFFEIRSNNRSCTLAATTDLDLLTNGDDVVALCQISNSKVCSSVVMHHLSLHPVFGVQHRAGPNYSTDRFSVQHGENTFDPPSSLVWNQLRTTQFVRKAP